MLPILRTNQAWYAQTLSAIALYRSQFLPKVLGTVLINGKTLMVSCLDVTSKTSNNIQFFLNYNGALCPFA